MWYVPKGKEVAPFLKYLQRDGAPPGAVAAAAKARKGKRRWGRWRDAREVEEVPRPAEWTLRIRNSTLLRGLPPAEHGHAKAVSHPYCCQYFL